MQNFTVYVKMLTCLCLVGGSLKVCQKLLTLMCSALLPNGHLNACASLCENV